MKKWATLRDTRVAANLSQRALAELSGFDRSEIVKFERGNRDVRLSTLKRLARALNVRVSDLVR